jgi:GntR family transcriptional regulator, rspAB operon transcriptional repressor
MKRAATANKRLSAYESVLSAIIFGDLHPGEATDERRIADRFDHGLAAVRDALARLAVEGLLERSPRVGTIVADLSIRDMQNVFEARETLEGRCAALAAARANADDIAALKGAFVGYEQVIQRRDFRTLVIMDRAFHRAVALATHNDQLIQIAGPLHNNASRFWYFGLTKLDAAAVLADIKLHLDVVAAIERRDPRSAERAMQKVLGHFPSSVMAFFGAATPPRQEKRSHDPNRMAWRDKQRPKKDRRVA